MIDALTFWTVVGFLVTWLGGLSYWVLHHHRRCHSAPLAAAAALEPRVGALEQQDERHARNIHALRGQISPLSLWVQIFKERHGIAPE